MIVQAPDNKTIDFGDLPPEQVTAAMQKLYPPQEQTTLGYRKDIPQLDSSLGHQIGLTARYPLEAAASIPAAVGNFVNSDINGLTSMNNKTFGTNIPQLGTNLGNDFSNLLTKMGLPQPEGPQQRIIGDASRGLAGTGMSAVASQAGNLTQMAARPLMQMISGGASGGAAGTAREAGGGPVAQIAAGVAGGLTPMIAANALQGAGRVIKSAAEPLYQGGRENIVGRAMNTMSSDPRQAILNMQNAQEFVPGSQPTTAEAARDYGLTGMQKGVKNANPEPFAQRSSEQNTARNILLDTVAQHDSALEAAKAARNNETGAMRDAAFEGKKPVMVNDVGSKISQILDSPEGKIEAVEKAMNWVKSRLSGESTPGVPAQEVGSSILDESGKRFTKIEPAKAPVGADAERLYSVRKDINDAMQGKYDSSEPYLRLAKGQLKIVKDALDDAIETGASGYKNYLSSYREHSIPINQMETAQEIKKGVMLAAPDTNGYDFISQPKWSNVVQANRAELARKLDPKQLQIMDNITADLDRGATLNNAAIKPAGSDTVQNLSLANVLGSVLGNKSMNPVTASLGRAYSFLYKLPDQAINQLVVDAMLDPRLARQMMQKANASNIQSFGDVLKQRALATGVGSFMGTNSEMQGAAQ